MQGKKEGRLSEKDVRAIVRLLGSVIGSPGDHFKRRRILMDGLARIVRADGWVWTMTQLDSSNTTVSLGIIHNGLSAEQLTAWTESSQQTQPALPEHEPMMELCSRGRHFTTTRQEIVSDASWYGNSIVQRYRLDVGLDHFLYTIYPFESGLLSAIGMYRYTGKKPFSARDRRLTHILTSEIKWLHEAATPSQEVASTPRLSRRLRSVLVLLLDGQTRKEIARLLGISPLTVRDYMETIYRHFDVSSHLELVRRFTRGDGGDNVRTGSTDIEVRHKRSI